MYHTSMLLEREAAWAVVRLLLASEAPCSDASADGDAEVWKCDLRLPGPQGGGMYRDKARSGCQFRHEI
jgi:hypothetical protein